MGELASHPGARTCLTSTSGCGDVDVRYLEFVDVCRPKI